MNGIGIYTVCYWIKTDFQYLCTGDQKNNSVNATVNSCHAVEFNSIKPYHFTILVTFVKNILFVEDQFLTF